MKGTWKISIIGVAVLFWASGCTTTDYNRAAPERVKGAVHLKDSNYDQVSTYMGPTLKKDTRRGLFVDNIFYGLSVTKNKTTAVTRYFVFVHVLYIGDWRLYQSISLPGGALIPAKSTSQEVNFCGVGCSHTEDFIVEIPSTQMADASSKGLVFRINARNSADDELSLASSYVVGVLSGSASVVR